MNQSRFNHSYNTNTGTGSSVGMNSLAGRGTQQVGRRPGDVTRIADMMRRRGNYAPALQLGMMGMQQAFQDQQGDKRFDQTKELRGIDQAFQVDQTKQGQEFQDQQGDKRFGQQQEMYGLQSADQMMRDQKHRGWQLEDQQNQGIDSAFAMPLPDGSGYVPMVKDKAGRASAAGGFMPTRKEVKQPTLEAHAKHFSDSLARGMVPHWDGEKYTYSELKSGKPVDYGTETTTTDAEGNVVQKQTRRKLPAGGDATAAGAANGATTPAPKKKTSSFLDSLLGG